MQPFPQYVFPNHFHFLGTEFKTPSFVAQSERENVILHFSNIAYLLELINIEILAAERLRLMGFDNRIIIDCFPSVVNILIW